MNRNRNSKPEDDGQGAATILTPQQFDRRWDAWVKYFGEKPIRASVYSILLIGLLGGPLIAWFYERGKARDLEGDLSKLERDHSALQTRYDNLETTVAPIIRQAAQEFPGEDIRESLEKVVARLEAEPVYSVFLNDIRLTDINVFLIPREPSQLNFSVQNVGAADMRDPTMVLYMPNRATNILSGMWAVGRPIRIRNDRIESNQNYIFLSCTFPTAKPAGAMLVYPQLEFQPSRDVFAFGVEVLVESSQGKPYRSRLWIIRPREGVTNSVVLTDKNAVSFLEKVSPEIDPYARGMVSHWSAF